MTIYLLYDRLPSASGDIVGWTPHRLVANAFVERTGGYYGTANEYVPESNVPETNPSTVAEPVANVVSSSAASILNPAWGLDETGAYVATITAASNGGGPALLDPWNEPIENESLTPVSQHTEYGIEIVAFEKTKVAQATDGTLHTIRLYLVNDKLDTEPKGQQDEVPME